MNQKLFRTKPEGKGRGWPSVELHVLFVVEHFEPLISTQKGIRLKGQLADELKPTSMDTKDFFPPSTLLRSPMATLGHPEGPPEGVASSTPFQPAFC